MTPAQRSTVEAIERYGREGFFVSVAYGHSRDLGLVYSVNVIHRATGAAFPELFAASCFADIAMILDN